MTLGFCNAAHRQEKLFELNYQTRETTAVFLRNLSTQQEDDSSKYIDFHYIKRAYETVEDLFKCSLDSLHMNLLKVGGMILSQ